VKVVDQREEPSSARNCSVIAQNKEDSAAVVAALDSAHVAARGGARHSHIVLAQKTEAAQHCHQCAEVLRTIMAATLDEADYDARNKAANGKFMSYLKASDKAVRCSDMKCKAACR